LVFVEPKAFQQARFSKTEHKPRQAMTLSCGINSASEVRKQSTWLAMNKFTETGI
jgi:hypothetical protein